MATMPKPDQHPHSTELPQLSNTDAGSSGGAPTAVGLPVGDCVGEPLGAHVSPSLVGAEVSGAAVGAPVGIVVGGCAVGAKVSGAAVGIAVGGSLHRPGIPARDACMHKSGTALQLDSCLDLSSQNGALQLSFDVHMLLSRAGPLQNTGAMLSQHARVTCCQQCTSRGAFMSSTTKNATEPLLGHTLPTLCVA